MNFTTLTSTVAVMLAAASWAQADFILSEGNIAIEGITPPLTTPYAMLSIAGDTASGQVTFNLWTSAHNAGPPINAVFNDVSFNTLLKADETVKTWSNGYEYEGFPLAVRVCTRRRNTECWWKYQRIW